MPDTSAAVAAQVPEQGLLQRLIGVLFSPGAAFAAVAAHPKAFGAIVVTTAITVGCQYAFMSTETGQEIVLDQQVRLMESFGMTVTDEAYAQMEQGLERAKYINPIATIVIGPLITAAVAGLLLVIFTMLLGGAGTFKQLFAVVSHAGIVVAVQQLFATPLSYASGRMTGANLGVFVPMLEESSFPVLFLNAIDLFLVWWVIVLAIGVAVVYRRKTTPIAVGFLSLYAVIALVLAFVRS